jgi:subtilase family serine protease
MCSAAVNWRRASKLRLEALEPRAMLSASPSPDSLNCHPNLNLLAAAGPGGLSPAQVLHAYGFDQVTWRGYGETIAIVDAYDDPTVAADLHAFDQQFGLADPKLTVAKLSLYGMSPTYDPLWAMEIALDVEWAHAIAPRANILLVEASSATTGALLNAVDYARHQPGVNVVSMSWGGPEFSAEGYYDSYFTTPAGHGNVTFVASSGDSGAPASWPSIASNVLAVGGTTLSLGTNNTYGGETAWSRSGGGYSPYETEPSYQLRVQTSGYRSNPDVAYDADPASGFAIYDNGSWLTVGGTSAGAPQWAALIARVNQARIATGKFRLNTALQAIYSLPQADFHDITVGSNGYAADTGYDAATGRGSPIAQFVIRDLINYKQPAVVPAIAATSLAGPTGLSVSQHIQASGGNFVGVSIISELSNPDNQFYVFAQPDGAAATTNAVSRDSYETSTSHLPCSSRDRDDAERWSNDNSGFNALTTSAREQSVQQDAIDACLADLDDLLTSAMNDQYGGDAGAGMSRRAAG